MKKITRIIFFHLLFLITIVSCQQDEPEIKTAIKGRVMDPSTGLPVANVKVYIWYYESKGEFRLVKPPPARPTKIIDSTLTDKNGYYSIVLKTNNSTDDYRVHFVVEEKYYALAPDERVLIGKINIINSWAYQTINLEAKISYNAIPKLPLRVYTWVRGVDLNTSLGGFELNKASGDTTVMLRVVPNLSNQIIFNYTDPDTSYKFRFYQETLEVPISAIFIQKTFVVEPNVFK